MEEEKKQTGEESSANSPELSELKKKLEESEKAKTEYLSGWQRAKADFINFKKDESRRMEDMMRYGNEDLIRELIVIMDSFDLGLRAIEKSGPVEKGIYMIRSQIEDTLKKKGLEKISVEPGTLFDPVVAEALAEIESEKPPGTVLEQIEPGYRLYDKIET